MENDHAEHAGACEVVEPIAGCEESTAGDRSPSSEPSDASSAGCALTSQGEAPGPTATKPPQTLREFERALRDLGFTRSQADAVARRGFGAFVEREAEEPDSVRDALSRLARILKD